MSDDIPETEAGDDAPVPPDETAEETYIETDTVASEDENEDEEECEYDLSYEHSGREEIRTAYSKVKSARQGDADAREDLEDATRRWHILTVLRPDVRNAAIETLIPLSLTSYAVLVAVFLLFMDPSSTSALYLTSENRIGDLFLANLALIVFSVAMFFIGPRICAYMDCNRSAAIRPFVRGGLIIFQLIPVAVLTVFLGATFRGDDVAQRGNDIFYNTLASARDSFPAPLVDIGEWYFDVSPFGFSAGDLLLVMFIGGLLLAVPYIWRLFLAVIYVIASSPEEFPDLELELELEDIHKEHDPLEAAAFERDVPVSESVTYDIDYDSVERLLQIPDAMRIEPYPDYVEVKRYWVREPYSYVTILKDEDQSDYRYFVIEPTLHEGEEQLLIEEFNERLGTSLLFKNIEDDLDNEDAKKKKVRVIEEEVLRLANEYDISVEEETFHKLLYYIERDYVFYGKLDTLIQDPNVEDISCDGDEVPVFVYHRHFNDLLSNISFEKRELRQFIIELAQRSGEHISAANPLLDASLPNGSRIQMSLGSEVTTRGSTFTIRLFQDEPFTPIDLISYETFSVQQMAYLWLAIEQDKSLIFAGGTASGKTTSMNAVSLFIPPKAKVITIEDTREISLPHENWIPGVTREGFGGGPEEEGAGAITMYHLLKAALRQRPEYMVVGEIRGAEATTLFQAMSTGHTTYSTMHADDVGRAINRLENPPINVPRQMIDSLNIMCIQNQVRIKDEETGDVKNVRRNEATVEIVEVGETVRTNQAFYRDAEMDEFRANLEESTILEEIRLEQGWNRTEVREELKNRERVLQYLLDNDIREVDDVTRTIQAYMLNPRSVIEKIDADALDPSKFKDITNVEFRLREECEAATELSRAAAGMNSPLSSATPDEALATDVETDDDHTAATDE